MCVGRRSGEIRQGAVSATSKRRCDLDELAALVNRRTDLQNAALLVFEVACGGAREKLVGGARVEGEREVRARGRAVREGSAGDDAAQLVNISAEEAHAHGGDAGTPRNIPGFRFLRACQCFVRGREHPASETHRTSLLSIPGAKKL